MNIRVTVWIWRSRCRKKAREWTPKKPAKTARERRKANGGHFKLIRFWITPTVPLTLLNVFGMNFLSVIGNRSGDQFPGRKRNLSSDILSPYRSPSPRKRKKTLFVSTPVLTALVKMSFFCAFFIFVFFCNFQNFQRCFLIGSQTSKNYKIWKQQKPKTTRRRKQDTKQK